MQSQNTFFDDLSKIATGAMGTFAGAAREFEANSKERFKEWVGGLDMVSREEFDAVRAMALAARAEIEALKTELAAMRAGAGGGAGSSPPPSVASVPTDEAARGGAGPDGQPGL